MQMEHIVIQYFKTVYLIRLNIIYFLFPQSEIDKNRNLVQNPGWN